LVIHADDLLDFLRRCLSERIGPYREVYLPVRSDDDGPAVTLAPLRENARPILDGARAVDPAKLLLYGIRERVAPFDQESLPVLLTGVKACDIKALEILDRALINDDFVDPVYRSWRERTTVLSADCTDAAPTCHCTLVGGKPYPETGFDANAARFGDHFYLEAATPKGKHFLDLVRANARVDTVHNTIPPAVEARRGEMTARIEAQSAAFARPAEYDRLKASPTEAWKEGSRECVGCGACTNICPTCYCLILNDESRAADFVKVRSYDSCQWHGYARVASGASPRPRMDERFRHRYLCKLVTMNGEFGTLGCTGCGRCTDACPGGIDFREVVHRLLAGAAGDIRPDAGAR